MILSNVDELSSGVMLQLCSILALLSGGRRDPAQTLLPATEPPAPWLMSTFGNLTKLSIIIFARSCTGRE